MKVITTLICRDEVSSVALLAMLHLLGVVARVSGVDKNSRVPILISYASFHFRITGTTLFHHKLIKVWLALIEQKVWFHPVVQLLGTRCSLYDLISSKA